jgi:Ca-activated chloride channel family protein
MAIDYYAVLGLPYNATSEEIRSAYFHLARSMHPDVNPQPTAQETFLAIQQAYDVLSNPQKKAAFDSLLPEALRQGPAITISARLSQPVLACNEEPQLFYALVEMICSADQGDQKNSASHVCLVLDRSTSMQGARMDMVKASSLNLLQQLRSQDMLSVVTFSDRAEVIVPPTRASSLSKSDHRISLLQTGGGTEILQGLTAGMEQLRKTDSVYLRHLILLTDGFTYGDEEGCIQLAREAAAEGIAITVLGIGHEWNDVLMDQIAALSGGSTHYVTAPHDIDHFLMQKLAEIEAVYARGLRFEFESSPGIEMRYAFRLSPNIAPLETQSPIALGDIQHRKSINFLLEFLVPGHSEEVDRLTLASGKVWMDMPGRPAAKKRVLLDLHCAVRRAVEVLPPPAVIVEAMSKLTLYRLQEKVRKEVSEGQVDRATRHMHYLATHLLSQGDRELAHTVLIEAEHVQQSRRFSVEGAKRIKYGTRALLLPSGLELKL